MLGGIDLGERCRLVDRRSNAGQTALVNIEGKRVAVLGAGAAGLSFVHLAARAGAQVALFEKHSLPGGCASWFGRTLPLGRVHFDAGATVLNSMLPGAFLDRMVRASGVALPRYHRMSQMRFSRVSGTGTHIFCLDTHSPEAWVASLVEAFPTDATALRTHFPRLAGVARALHGALEKVPHLPLQSPADAIRNLRLLPELAPVLPWLIRDFAVSFGELLDSWHLSSELRAWIEMNLLITLQARAVEVHSLWGALALFFYSLDAGALDGGMRGLFEPWLAAAVAHPRVKVFVRTSVQALRRDTDAWRVLAGDRTFGPFDLVVSAVPRWNTEALVGHPLFDRRVAWDEIKDRLWGAIAAYVVIRDELALPDAPFNHHSSLEADPRDGGEAYLSFSARGDLSRAPTGYRCVTISSHTRLEKWSDLAYLGRKLRKTNADGDVPYVLARDHAGGALLRHLAAAYPGIEIVYSEFATPRTFERYTGRKHGTVGGVPMTRDFTLFHSLPQRTRHESLWQIGDTAFPGQSVFACALGASAAYEQITGSRVDF